MFRRLSTIVTLGGAVIGEVIMSSRQRVMFRKVSACVLALAVVCGGAVPASAAVRVSDADRKNTRVLLTVVETNLSMSGKPCSLMKRT